MPLLARFGLTAAFFLSGASLTAPRRFWWELLETAANHDVDALAEIALGRRIGGQLTLEQLAEQIGAMSPEDRDEASARLRRVVGADPDESGLRAHEVRALVAAGFELGFHTLRHDALPPLDEERLAVALIDGRQALADAAGHELTMLAYPHGQADRRVATAASAAGYELGFTGSPEPVTKASDALLLGRLDMAARTPLQFVLVLVRTLLR
jgi:peptidoglycan/xylan/chitin deacetylase (PgdA/CDA1 family)